MSDVAVKVKVLSGSYRNQPVVNKTFPLIKPYKSGAKGGFVTVDGSAVFGKEYDKIRVTVDDIMNVEYINESGAVLSNRVLVTASEDLVPAIEEEIETDAEIITRIRNKFEVLDTMTEGTVSGDVRALIVVGPPGVGKSFGVERILEKFMVMDDLAGRDRKYEIVRGAMTPIGLYCKLNQFKDHGNVLVFDDCDTILLDDVSLNILKAALDSSKRRVIHWNADSNMLRREGVPDHYEFKGSVIFITNLKFNNVRSAKLKDHLAALSSRCHYLDLSMNTMRDKILRIKQIAKDGALFEDYGLNKKQEKELLDFMEENKNKLNEMSLRMAIKLADLRKMTPDMWQKIAAVTCMKN